MTYSFSYLEPVCCSMSSSNCCFLTSIQVSQEAGQVVSASGKQGAHDGEKLSRRSMWNEIVVMVAQKTNRLKPLNYTLENGFKSI